MLHKFPPVTVDRNDKTFLVENNIVFAKQKIETRAGKRTVLLTSHTILFVVKGKKLLHFADGTIEVCPGELVLLNKGIYVMAEYIPEGLSFEAIMIFLSDDILQQFSKSVSPVQAKRKSYIVCQGTPLTNAYRDQVRYYFGSPLQHVADLFTLKQREIISLLLASGFKAQISAFVHAATNMEAGTLKQVVEENMFQPINLIDLANLCNRSLASFNRDFKNVYNCSPRHYINEQRLLHASLLLRNTNKRISEIADECGFESASYFIRSFKRKFGYTPASIRIKSAIN